MPITNHASWESRVDSNKGRYGKQCVDVARQVMRILDAEPGEFDARKLICRACDEIKAEDLKSFMAGTIACIVSQVHSRGSEFRRTWNCNNHSSASHPWYDPAKI